MLAENETIRGKYLHPEIAKRSKRRFESNFFDDAAVAAFKVVETRLRNAVGPSEGTPAEVLNRAWNPTTGLLHSPTESKAAREALYMMFRGAFGYFRNPIVHDFVNLDEDQCFDLIVLANRLYLIVESAIDSAVMDPETWSDIEPKSEAGDIERIALPYGREDFQSPRHFLLDVDGDGIDDLVILPASGSDSEVIVVSGSNGMTISIDPPRPPLALLEGSIAVDLDCDGRHELVLTGGWDTTQGFAVYKYRGKQLELLTKDDRRQGRRADAVFVDAYVTDLNSDGMMEIVEEPWDSVPDDLLPDEDFAREFGWGRVRYIWSWSVDSGSFQLKWRQLLYIGGR